MLFWVLLIGLAILKMLVIPAFPLIGDEAYYWLWGQHLALSYVDHPPMIAYLNFILASLFGNSELAIRLAAITIVSTIACMIYLTGKELFDKKSGETAGVIFLLLPLFFGGGMFLVPQMLLFFFWSISFYLMVKIIKTQKPFYWYLLGISAGLGLLSDYVMALFIVGTVLFCALNKETRFWFTKKDPYLGLGLCLLLFLPVLIWNFQLGFTPLFYWGGKMGAGPRIGDNLLNFFGLQMVLYTPAIFFSVFYLIFRDKNNPLFKIYSAMVFIPFLIISPLMNIGGHWPATAYLPAIINSPRLKKWAMVFTIIFALLINGLGLTYYLFFYPTPPELRGKETSINRELPSFLREKSPAKGKTFYFANDLGMIGLVSFHGKTRTYMAPGRLKQVDMWGKPEIKKGDNILYFALNETPLFDKLKPFFNQVSIEKEKRLFTKDADLPNKLQIYICEGFRGGRIP